MELYYGNDYYKLYHGSMLDMLDIIEPNSISSIVTDPPYELNFMGKGWDNAGISFNSDTWKKCFEVLKPGGYLLAFGGSRTFHRIACAIEDAGFEIRDTIMWLYGSGFPKSMNVGLAIDKKNGVESKIVGYEEGTMPDFRDVGKKQKEISGIDKLTFGQIENSERKQQPIYEPQNEWKGWGTALKPAFEPIIVARKPFKGSLVDNVLENRTGAINIDECRVELQPNETIAINVDYTNNKQSDMGWGTNKCITEQGTQGRFPANVILSYDQITFDEVCGGFPVTNKPNGSITKNYKINNQVYGDYGYCNTWDAYQDSGSACRYFYCAKASKKDRDNGLDEFEEKRKAGYGYDLGYGNAGEGMFKDRQTLKKNTHPTVKPTTLMQYLVRLVTPKGGIVLDPFNGSGSTGKATMYENNERDANYKYIGIELTEEYLPISRARINYAICDK